MICSVCMPFVVDVSIPFVEEEMGWENEGLQAFCEKHGKKKRQRAPVRVESRLSDTYQDDDYV